MANNAVILCIFVLVNSVNQILTVEKEELKIDVLKKTENCSMTSKYNDKLTM